MAKEYLAMQKDLDNHVNTHNIKTYTSLTQLGLTVGSETIESIAKNLPIGGMLTYGTSSSYAKIYPTDNCVIQVNRHTANTVKFIALSIDDDCMYFSSFYIPTLQHEDWKELANADEYLPLTGGTLTGPIWCSDRTYINGHGNDFTIRTYKNNDRDLNNSDALQFMPTKPLNEILKIFRYNNSASPTPYNIFGQHNKPSGSYTGNGSAAERKIETGGIGDFILIQSNVSSSFAIVTKRGGALCKTDEAVRALKNSKCAHNSGVLTLLTDDAALNANGVTYEYYIP